MYYHRVIVNFKKTASRAPYFVHLVVDIEQDGTDLLVYPKNQTGNYLIAYGIIGSVSNIDPDKVYDYHTAFDVKPSKINVNVPIDIKGHVISNTPSMKSFIFPLSGKYNKTVDAKYIYLGGAKNIIAPFKCQITKCFVYSETNLSHKLMLIIESTNSQNQRARYYSYLGTINKYQVFHTSHTYDTGNLTTIWLRNEDDKLTVSATSVDVMVLF